jgi:glucose-1-phosphate adenylyltransferase
VPEGAQIGVDPDLDRSRYQVSAGGIVVLGKRQLALP